MDSFTRLMQTHHILMHEFEQLRSQMQKTLFYLQEFNRNATTDVEESKKALLVPPNELQNNRRH